MARMNNWWMGVKNWLKASGAPAKRRSISHRRLIGLEILEERAVPAIITVTNLLDGTNPTSPLPGSLREAVKVLAKPGDEIHFDQALFASGTPQILTLNGAVGALQIEQNNITIVGPGKFTSGAFAGTYQLTIQADYGFQDTIPVTNGGSGYRVGDLIDQGSTKFTGGARFQVLTINNPVGGVGGVTSVRVVNPGSNKDFPINAKLSTSGQGINNLAPVGAVSGTGLELEPNGNIGLASGLIFTQLITSNPQNFSISGLHFGASKDATIHQNLGSLIVKDCLFDSPATNFIYTVGPANSVDIRECVFDSLTSGPQVQILDYGSGPLTILNSRFIGGLNQVAHKGSNSVSLTGSEFISSKSSFAGFALDTSINLGKSGTSSCIVRMPPLTASPPNPADLPFVNGQLISLGLLGSVVPTVQYAKVVNYEPRTNELTYEKIGFLGNPIAPITGTWRVTGQDQSGYGLTTNGSGVSIKDSKFGVPTNSISKKMILSDSGQFLITVSKDLQLTQGEPVEIFATNSEGQLILQNSVPVTQYGRVFSYDRMTGELVVEKMAFRGAGTFDNWEISFKYENRLVISTSGNVIADNSYWQNIWNGAFAQKGGLLRMTNSAFQGNNNYQLGFPIDTSTADPDNPGWTLNPNRGGSAIFAYGGANLTIRRSIFENNTSSGIQTFNSGGGAIFSYSGQVVIDQCGFTGNAAEITDYPNLDPANDQTDFVANPEKMPSAANSGGGAVYSGGATSITNSYFTGNRVSSSVDFWYYTASPQGGSTPAPSLPQYGGGGGIFLTSNNSQNVNSTLSNVTLTENFAEIKIPKRNPYIGTSVQDIVSGDFNGDSFPDMIVATNMDSLTRDPSSTRNIEVWLGTSTAGNFIKPNASRIMNGPVRITSVGAGDFDKDGFLDLAVGSNTASEPFCIFWNKGGKGNNWKGFDNYQAYTFEAQGNQSKPSNVLALETGFLNQDTIMDIAFVCDMTQGNVWTILGRDKDRQLDSNIGKVTYFGTTVGNSSNKPTSLSIGKLNVEDGLNDIAVGMNSAADNVYSLINNNFSPGYQFDSYPLGSAGSSPIVDIGIGNFDPRTDPTKGDIVAVNADSSNNVQLLLNYDYTTNKNWSGSTIGSNSRSLEVADFTGDGADDLGIAQYSNPNNLQIGRNDGKGVFTANPYTFPDPNDTSVSSYAKNARANALTLYQFDSKAPISLLLGNSVVERNLVYCRNNNNGLFGFYNLIGTTEKPEPTATGLTGGALFIASGVNPSAPNAVPERSFNGTTTAVLANTTITNNYLKNPYVYKYDSSGKLIPVINSNAGTTQAGYYNQTDTGGIFFNLSTASKAELTNVIVVRNIGLVYVNGIPQEDYSNSGTRYSASNPGPVTTLGYNFYGRSSSFGFIAPGKGDLPSSDTAPVFDLFGLKNNLGPQIGLLLPNPALPNKGQGNILTMALDRLSPARDAGNDLVFTAGSPVQLNTDARGVRRKVNLAVDMGAYEVQIGTATDIEGLTTDSTQVNPYLTGTYGVPLTIKALVEWNDVVPPPGVISGTAQLVSEDNPGVVFATATVTGDPDNVLAGGEAVFQVNSSLASLLPAGVNNFQVVYSGDPTWAPSQSNSFSILINPAATAVMLNLNPPPLPPLTPQQPNTGVTYSGLVNTASIQVPQGSLNLRARKLPGGSVPMGAWTNLATVPVDSQGKFNFNNVNFATPGNYEVQAVFTSITPSQFTNSTSASVVQEIGYYFTAAVPLTAFSVDPITLAGTPVSTVERGDLVTLKATARFNTADGLPLGTVQFLTPAGTVIGSGTGNLVAPGQMEYTLANIDPTMLPLGSSQIIASYTRQWTIAGDPYLSMNTLNSQPLTITSIATTTSLTAAPASLIYGNNLLLTATVSPTKAGVNYQAGTIDFYSGTLKLASVPVTGNSPSATLNTKTLTPGNYSITAVYSGDGLNYGASSSAPRTVVVDKASTALAISVTPPATVTIPNQVTITASLTNNAGPGAAKPSGLIYLYRNGVTLANWDLSQSGTPTFTDTPYVAGTYTYELRYTGDVNYQAASPVSQVVQAIVSPVTTTTLQVSANSTVYGTPLVFTANVAPAAGVAYQPGRKVKFEAWNGPTLVNLGESTLGLNTNGWPLPVEITSSSLPAGNWDIKALYEGDGPGGYYLPSTSVPVPLTVTKAATSLSLAISGTYVDGRAAVPFTMTLKNDAQVPSLPPSGSIMVMANGNTIRTLPVTPGLTTYTVSDWIPGTAGTFNLVASYSGDNNYQTANATGQVTTYLKTNTQTGVTVVPASTTYGNSVLLTANVTPAGLPAGGQVQFYVNGVALGAAQTLDANQKASLTTTTLDVGAQSITAKYLGRPPEYLESISAPAVVTVAKAATSMTLVPSSTLIPTGTPVTLTATLTESVSPPAQDPVGNIEFWVDGVSMGSAPIIKGVATYTVTPQIPKTYLYEAKFAGSGTYFASAASTKVTAYQGALEKYYVVAPQVGSGLYIYDRATNRQAAVLYPMGPSYSGGFTVTRGDINGDGVSDIVFSGRNTGLVQAIDGNDFTLIGSASPFGAGARFPLSIAVGDVNGDGKGDIISAPAGIGMPPHVVAISGKDFRKALFSQYAYSAQFKGGVSVAAGEVNGDGVADIITAPLVGAPPHIVSFSGATGKVLQSYYAYSPQYMGGTSIVASDLDNDGYAEIITGASAAAPHIVIVDSKTQKVKASFYAFEPGFSGGLRVSAVQDVNGDGIDDILVAPGAGAPPNVLRLDGKKALQNQLVVLDSFLAYGFADPATNYYGGTSVG